jgi:hypothetical protein
MDARTLSPPAILVMPQQALTTRAPTSALDPYTDQALLKPWPLYRELRRRGRLCGSKNTKCLPSPVMMSL